MEHKCKAMIVKNLNYNAEDSTEVAIGKDARGWWLSLMKDGNVIETKVNVCPFCGEKLV